MESQVEKDLKGPYQTIYFTLEQRLTLVFTKDNVTLLVLNISIQSPMQLLIFYVISSLPNCSYYIKEIRAYLAYRHAPVWPPEG